MFYKKLLIKFCQSSLAPLLKSRLHQRWISVNFIKWDSNKEFYYFVNGVIQKVRSLGKGEGRSLKSEQKRTGGGGRPSMCVRSLFLKKMLRFSKWSFIVIPQFFLLIVMKIDSSACFYFAQLLVLFPPQSNIFFAHFQQKWLLIHGYR